MAVAGLGGRRHSAERPGAERLVVDLREQLRALSQPPPLPAGWELDVAHAVADGALFGGDFAVPLRSGEQLQLVLVDVSGKGLQAGIRALLLAAAVSGILGAVGEERVLPVLNAHLLRQGWDDGFCTAVHLAVSLPTGAFRIAVAGHPPPAQFHAGSGQWELLEASGPALGIAEQGEWLPVTGRLLAGDALLAYTDGCVERPSEDIYTGIDRLLGAAYRQVLSGFSGAATKLIGTNTGSRDDRAVTLLVRSA
ncbi:MAG: PP2C family protein-serine/threonine phosphatase [Mycobacteriales bacterium]